MDTYNSLHEKFLKSGKEVIVPDYVGGHQSTDYIKEGGVLYTLRKDSELTIFGEAAKIYFAGRYHLNRYNYLIIVVSVYKVPSRVEIDGIHNLEEFELSLHLLHEFCHVVEREGGRKILRDDPREYFTQTLKILNDLPSEYKKGFMNINSGAKGKIKFSVGDKELV